MSVGTYGSLIRLRVNPNGALVSSTSSGQISLVPTAWTISFPSRILPTMSKLRYAAT